MMAYRVVIADHDGAWHAVGGSETWETAVALFGSVLATLAALGYYDAPTPAVVKIIPAGETEYAKAKPLAAPL